MALPQLLFALLLATASAVEETCLGTTKEVRCAGGPQSSAEYLQQLAASGYDKSRRPPCGNGRHFGPTVVEVQFRLTQLNRVDAKLGTIAVNGYLRTWWHDARLAFNTSEDRAACIDVVKFPGLEHEAPIWMPDIFVDNLVDRTVEGTDSMTEISPDGSVWHSEQAIMVVKMPFDLGKLPFDQHTAKITLASYSLDNSRLRLIARGGTVGAPESGEGLKAIAMSNSVWSFEYNGDNVGEMGFTTPGRLTISDGWDYIGLWWILTRKPKYFIIQVVVPCTLFLLVSYIQFFVDPNAAPARAALAVIPVLIMRTMSNSIYKSIPEGSQYMWLDDFVTTSMFLCVFAAIHFSIVQYMRILEKRRATKLDGLKNSRQTTQRLTELAHLQGVPLIELLQKFAPVETELTHDQYRVSVEQNRQEVAAMEQDKTGPTEPAASEEDGGERVGEGVAAVSLNVISVPSVAGRKMKKRSEAAEHEHVTEADLLFISYAKTIFRRYDVDQSNEVSPMEVAKLFTYFDIYMSAGQAARTMCRFLRDLGQPTPLDESTASLNFSQFVSLLMQVERYSLRRDIGVLHVKAYFHSIPPSERWDIAARFGFPVLIFLQFTLFFLLLGAY